MDGARFDELVRRALGSESRRGILRVGLGSLLASGLTTLGLSGADDVAAKKKKKKKKKKSPPAVLPVSPPPPPVSPPSPPPPPPPPPPPTCGDAREACPVGNCCAGLICDDNFCSPPPVCCGPIGATCEFTCDCCGGTSFCDPATNTCGECSGRICPSGECIDGECCDGSQCGNPQLCENNTCVCVLGLKCGLDCCQTDGADGEVCHFSTGNPATCQPGGCPTYNYCNDATQTYTCGDGCECVTSIEGEHICTDGSDAVCFDCANDSDCEGVLGAGAICLEGGPLCPCDGGNLCIRGECASAAPLGAQGRSTSFLRSGAKPSASANHKHPEPGKSGHGARKQHNKRGRRT